MGLKKILVTGASGYLGARLCSYFADRGYEVTAILRSNAFITEEWALKLNNIMVGDVRDEKWLNEIANQHQFDVMIHLVSLNQTQSNGSPSVVSAVNVTPVWNLLDIFSKKGLQKFIYFSTMQVYGTTLEGDITEESKTNASNIYALTHQLGEEICHYYHRRGATQCRIVRLSNSYGTPIFNENNCWHLVVNELCKMAYEQNKITLQSDGTPLRDFIHGWDVCAAVQQIMETEEPHLTYNVSSGHTISLMDIALKVKKIYEQRYSRDLIIDKNNHKSSSHHYYRLNNNLLTSIGFETKIDLEMGINNLFDYLEQQKK